MFCLTGLLIKECRLDVAGRSSKDVLRYVEITFMKALISFTSQYYWQHIYMPACFVKGGLSYPHSSSVMGYQISFMMLSLYSFYIRIHVACHESLSNRICVPLSLQMKCFSSHFRRILLCSCFVRTYHFTYKSWNDIISCRYI